VPICHLGRMDGQTSWEAGLKIENWSLRRIVSGTCVGALKESWRSVVIRCSGRGLKLHSSVVMRHQPFEGVLPQYN
jgi:hypothetical protein